jgi:hypothetical protein
MTLQTLHCHSRNSYAFSPRFLCQDNLATKAERSKVTISSKTVAIHEQSSVQARRTLSV